MDLEIIKKIKLLHEKLDILSEEIGIYSNEDLLETMINHREEISILAKNLSNLADYIQRVYEKKEI